MAGKNRMTPEDLFKEFKPVTRKEWEAVIENDLSNSDYKEQLLWNSEEGFSALPFYMREDFQQQSGARARDSLSGPSLSLTGETKIAEDITSSDIKRTNELAHDAIKNGVDTLLLTSDIATSGKVRGRSQRGVPIQSQRDMRALLDGIDLNSVSIVFDGNSASIPLAAMFMNDLERRTTAPGDTSAHFIFDPFTTAAGSGYWPYNHEFIQKFIAEAAHIPFPALAIDGTFYHHCGASMVQEIGIALSLYSEYLASASREGVTNNTDSRPVILRLSSASYYFPEIAKFRAIRLLMEKVQTAYPGEISRNFGFKIIANTSPWTKTIAEPHNNILRSITESMAAIAGGADILHILPFDYRFRESNSFSRRIARNVHHILKHESHFHNVTDPGNGSYYIEYLTDQMAEKCWNFFQSVEQKGGFSKALESGYIHKTLESSKKNKLTKIRKSERVFIGCNQFTNPDENWPDLQSIHDSDSSHKDIINFTGDEFSISALRTAFSKGADISDFTETAHPLYPEQFNPLTPWYAASEFEKLRSGIANIETKTGRAISVVILPIGRSSSTIRRTNMARNLFEAAGYRISELQEFESIEELIREVLSKNPDIIALAGSDNHYNKLVGTFCNALKTEVNDIPVLTLTGSPDQEKKFREEGIDHFIRDGSDMIEILSQIQKTVEERIL
jgi:methylmalonyl-CoA mutase